ncbi:phage protein [Streptococcus varani]|uniref:Phage protein n=1 Tax=Streptococcus varani TaxID=1608583 RepID=A0A0E4H593_9STRE|nr:ImmA/IrrE family metallo-endopeptidase [Streptococcus varani]CQR25889.1 phage protein [Streptococcus varani]
MSAEELCKSHGISICYFEGDVIERNGFYNPQFNAISINSKLYGIHKDKVIYHELGHREHTASYYKLNKEKSELQADRCMIHHLLKEELSLWDDLENFNYTYFMEKYELTSLADEVMVIEEFYNLANII